MEFVMYRFCPAQLHSSIQNYKSPTKMPFKNFILNEDVNISKFLCNREKQALSTKLYFSGSWSLVLPSNIHITSGIPLYIELRLDPYLSNKIVRRSSPKNIIILAITICTLLPLSNTWFRPLVLSSPEE